MLSVVEKPRILTGDTPTGRLHLGHWIGSVKTRVALQKSYDCYFIIADLHALTTHLEKSQTLQKNILDITLDYLAVGIDPEKSNIFVQSKVSAISELTYLFSMLLPFSRVTRNPTLKEELSTKKLKNPPSFGFVLYPVGQVADILAFRPLRVPVGADQLPHLEMTKEVARRFNQLYCGVDTHTHDDLMTQKGGLFPIVEPEPIEAKRLVGIGPPNSEGILPKMSKSLDNAIYLSDSPDVIQKKIKCMYTDPRRVRITDPGNIDNNPLWKLHDAFNEDKIWVENTKARYQKGDIGDVECKKKLTEVIIELTEPMRKRRYEYEKDLEGVLKILKKGTEGANQVAEETLKAVKTKMSLDVIG